MDKLDKRLFPPPKPRIFQNRDAYIMRREVGPEKGLQQLGTVGLPLPGHVCVRSSRSKEQPSSLPGSTWLQHALPARRRLAPAPGLATLGSGGCRWLAIWLHRRLSGPTPPHRPALYFLFLSVLGGWGGSQAEPGVLVPSPDFWVSSGHPGMLRICSLAPGSRMDCGVSRGVWPGRRGRGQVGCEDRHPTTDEARQLPSSSPGQPRSDGTGVGPPGPRCSDGAHRAEDGQAGPGDRGQEHVRACASVHECASECPRMPGGSWNSEISLFVHLPYAPLSSWYVCIFM